MKITNEPVLVSGALIAVMTALQSFGVPLTGTQISKVDGAVHAIGVLVLALMVRSQVTPTPKP